MKRNLGAFSFLLSAAVSVPAQDPGQPSPFANGQDRAFRIGRVELDQAPVIDGSLDDPAWQTAPEIGALVEVEPRMGLVPGQRTVVRMIHDENNVYIAVWCYDDQPENIRANIRQRDAMAMADDRFSIIFDTFHNRRTGFEFGMSAGGSRSDTLISNNGSRMDRSWDAIWDGHSRVTNEGWQAEMYIPFASLSMATEGQVWGFNFRRNRRYTNEEYRWANARQGNPFDRISEFGTLDGLGETSIGVGLDVVPYVKSSTSRARLTDPNWDTDNDIGGELWYRITPALRLGITINTDFAETEIDDRQINLDRFPLFFPEKRDFFLRDAERFTFGNTSRFRPSFLPFFSRRIGLDDQGEEIPILWGAKMAGEHGPLEVGFLGVQTDSTTNVPEKKELGVLRLNYALASETTLGVIGTSGRPTDPGDNTLLGVDLYHREPVFIGDQDLRLWAWGTTTQTSGDGGEGNYFGLRAMAMGREWEYGLDGDWIDEGFNPELGFIRRTGDRNVGGNLKWKPRPDSGPVRNWETGIRTRVTYDEDFDRSDVFFSLSPKVRFQTGDEITFNFRREYDRIDSDFMIVDDTITIPAGDYWTTRYQLMSTLSSFRSISGRLEASYGDFFDGTSWESKANLSWRTGPLVILGAQYNVTRGTLTPDEFITHIAQAKVDLQFSPWVTWNNLIQFDNESENLGVQSRLRWITTPGSDLFVVFTGGWLRGADETFRPDTQDFTVKLVHTFRF